MRITVLCADLGIRVPGAKGASVHLQAITRALAAVGHEVQLVAVAGHESPPQALLAAVDDMVLLPHPGRLEGLARERQKIAFNDHLLEKVTDRVQQFGPDTLYERLSLFGTSGLRLADLTSAIHVVEINALLAREDAAWRGLHLRTLARELEATVLRSADLCVAVSDEVAAQVRSVAPFQRTAVVPNGVDTEAFRYLPSKVDTRSRFGLPPEARIALFIGVLRPWHGVDVAIRALGRLATQDLMLVIVGDGAMRPELEQLAGHEGVAERVRFIGQLDHTDVPALLAAGDVALAPYPAMSDFSFSPLKLYEYLAAGVPVVASDIGQIREVLGAGSYGTLVTPGDVDGLAAAIDAVSRQPRLVRRAAAAGRAHAMRSHGWGDRAMVITGLIDEERNRALAR
jgi:glycosyltransferase involved in cell wall biosynthesis